MATMRLVALVAVVCLVAGCSERPLAGGGEPDRPSRPAIQPRDLKADGEFTVSSAAAQDDGSVCLFVGTEDEEPVSMTKGRITLEWAPESSLAGPLVITVVGATVLSVTGASPLSLNWTAVDGPAVLPFGIRVSQEDDSLTVRQSVAFDLGVTAYSSKELLAFSGAC